MFLTIYDLKTKQHSVVVDSVEVNISHLHQDGATLMHYAVQTASSQTMKILLLYSVDINLADDVRLFCFQLIASFFYY